MSLKDLEREFRVPPPFDDEMLKLKAAHNAERQEWEDERRRLCERIEGLKSQVAEIQRGYSTLSVIAHGRRG